MTPHLLFELIASLPTPPPSPSVPGNSGVSEGGSGSAFVPYATLVAAIIAAGALFLVNLIQRNTANKNLQHLKDVAASNEARAQAEGLAKRYQDAASQIGHEKPAVRLAGVYALARLADDWPEQRQTCVDVLCAVLRMRPMMTTYTSDDGYSIDDHDDGDMQVRKTVIGIVSSRVSGEGALWGACDFNLVGSYLVDFRLRDAIVSGGFLINGSTIDGVCEFTRSRFDGGLDARNLRIEGSLRLTDVLPGPQRSVAFSETFIASSGTLDFVLSNPPKSDQAWEVWPNKIRCAGLFSLKVKRTSYEQAKFRIPELHLLPSATFRAALIPTSDPGNTEDPKIEAKEWSTTDSSKIHMPRLLRRKHMFDAYGWTGVQKAQFERAYAPPQDIDNLLGSENGDAGAASEIKQT